MGSCDCIREGEKRGIGEGISGVAVDKAFSLLAHEQRRKLLYQLHNRGVYEISVKSLANMLEDDSPERIRPPRESKEATRTELYHQHLPKLDDAGVIDFDRESRTVTYHADPLMEDLLGLVDKWEE